MQLLLPLFLEMAHVILALPEVAACLEAGLARACPDEGVVQRCLAAWRAGGAEHLVVRSCIAAIHQALGAGEDATDLGQRASLVELEEAIAALPPGIVQPTPHTQGPVEGRGLLTGFELRADSVTSRAEVVHLAMEFELCHSLPLSDGTCMVCRQLCGPRPAVPGLPYCGRHLLEADAVYNECVANLQAHVNPTPAEIIAAQQGTVDPAHTRICLEALKHVPREDGTGRRRAAVAVRRRGCCNDPPLVEMQNLLLLPTAELVQKYQRKAERLGALRVLLEADVMESVAVRRTHQFVKVPLMVR
jgi:hypothetical protein